MSIARHVVMGGVYNGANWAGHDLSNWDFSSAVLNSCSFSGALLAGADFSSAVLNSCDFRRSNGQGADFSSAILNSCSFDNAVLDDADFTGAQVGSSSFGGVDTDSIVGFQGRNLHANTGGASVVTFGSTSTGNVTVGSSVVSTNGGVSLVSNGISWISFDPWLHILNDGHSYRIERPGTNIAVTGSYTFVNGDRYLWTSPRPGSSLMVVVGRVIDGAYDQRYAWDLKPNEWCEITASHF